MESCNQINLEEKNLIAAAEQIFDALGSRKTLTDDLRKALVRLGSQLSTMSTTSEEEEEEEHHHGISEIVDRLDVVQDKIMSYEVDNNSIIWNSGQDQAFEYLNAADEARRLIERLETACFDKQKDDLLWRAHDVLQTAMARLEEELEHVLVQNEQPLIEPESHNDDGSTTVEPTIDLININVIPYLRFIAEVMFNSNHEHECTKTYISVRKQSLCESLLILEMEKTSIEDLLRIEWDTLDSKIRSWVQVMKYFVRVTLPSEKLLSDRVFGETESASSTCFLEISKASMLQLLNFGEAIAVGPHRPEKMIRILDMYEMLAKLLPEIHALYSDQSGFSIRNECYSTLQRLGDCVSFTFLGFENAIKTNSSVIPFAGGGIHHLTGYVMNYLNILTDYTKTLDYLLEHLGVSLGGELSCNYSPITRHLQSVASILETNLYEKSKLYKDDAMQHFFLMNNVHYLTQKVKNSDLRQIFGDKWIRKNNWKFQQYAMDYEKATWGSILGLLKEKESPRSDSGSNIVLKLKGKENSRSNNVLKLRFKNFHLAFEDVYKIQTAWNIQDLQLREDLRISSSLKVIQAYRLFCGRHNNQINDKHIKYSADDLENHLLDLFEGSPKSLQNNNQNWF